MKRRDFLRIAGGGTAASATVAGTAAAQEDGGGGGSTTVTVGPGGQLVFDPEEVQVKPGTTIEWTWESDNHNIVVDSQPDGANWEGTEGEASVTYNTGHTYSHTFETLGTYEYACEPHRTAGMLGTVVVTENPDTGGGEGGPKELHELGVPIQAHWVGSATILGIIVTLAYTFYVLKYGESPNTGTGRN
jgi:plastocyanin